MSNINGTPYDDQLSGTTGADVINGYDGSDILYGDAGNDTLNGGNGLDDLEGGAGNDYLNGGADFDFASYILATAAVNVSLATTMAQNTGGAGIDTLVNIEGLIGSAYNDTLTGDGNLNILDGGAGRDTLIGGGGDDILSVSKISDYVAGEYYDGGSGYNGLILTGWSYDLSTSTLVNIQELDCDGTVLVAASQLNGLLYLNTAAVTIKTAGTANLSGCEVWTNQFYLGVPGITLNLAGSTGAGHVINGSSGGDSVTGSLQVDTIYGNAGNDALGGGGGADYIYGGDGDDTIDGGDGSDILYGDAGNDTISGGGGNDQIWADNDFVADSTHNVLNGGDGNDTIYAGGGNDTINGDAGDDQIWAGSSTAYGGDGNDTIHGSGAVMNGDADDDLIFADGGDNKLYGGDGNDYLQGNSGSDVLYGGGGNDTLYGSNGIDTETGTNALYGEAGDDTFFVGAHDSTLDGGDGNDTFVMPSSPPTSAHISGGAGLDTLSCVGSLDLSAIDMDGIEQFTSDWPYCVFSMSATALNGVTLLKAQTVNVTAAGTAHITGATIDVSQTFELMVPGITLDFTGSTGHISVSGSNGTDIVTLGATGGFVSGYGGDDIINGGDGNDYLCGGDGNDTLLGGDGADLLSGEDGDDSLVAGGGMDTVLGGAGNDTFDMGAAFTAADSIDGGAGTDTLLLNGNYATGVVLGPTTLTNVETIRVAAGHSYKLTSNDATVAAGGVLTVDGSSLASSYSLNFDGSAETDGAFDLIGGAGKDVLTGGAGNDTLVGGDNRDTLTGGAGNDRLVGGDGSDVLSGGDGNDMIDPGTGNDTVYGGDGNDTIDAGADLIAADSIDGGAGTDTLLLNGNYSTTFTFGSTTLTNIENIVLADGNSYKLTTNDATVAAGQTLTVDGSTLTSSYRLTFTGSAETDGAFDLLGGAGKDVLTGGAGADTLDGGDNNDTLTGGAGDDRLNGGNSSDVLSGGDGNDMIDPGTGNDTVTGGNGNDTIDAGANLTSSDRFDGGAGTDTLLLNGNYATTVTFGATTLTNVESIVLGAGNSYKLTTNDGTVASGATLTVDGSALTSSYKLTFNGTAETDGKFVIIGGAGADTLTGGSGNDTLWGGSGKDALAGGSGADSYAYAAVSDSTGLNYDMITGFDASVDKIDTWFSVTGIDAALTTGSLYKGTFEANLTSALSTKLGAGHAILFTPNAGTYAGHTFLIVDANGTAGYQAGADLVFKLASPTNLGSLGIGTFT